jgi:hypothetical protein|tara:strand:+ start:410 stop:751 length:342 start_codon:yes stop_codon:yes gene_type:complete
VAVIERFGLFLSPPQKKVLKKKYYKMENDWNKIKKELFRKPTGHDYLILFILICIFFLVWAYKHDINACGEVLQACEDNCYPNLVNPQAPRWMADEFDFNISVDGSDNLSLDT